MLVKRIAIQNVRSFLDREELKLDGLMSIIIGPNGGGKTNLLDITVTMLRRHLYASMYAAPAPGPDAPQRHEFRPNDVLGNMVFEPHASGGKRDQLIEIEIEITERDVESVHAMRRDAELLLDRSKMKYANVPLGEVSAWNVNEFRPKDRMVYVLTNGQLQSHDLVDNKPADNSTKARTFLRFLQLFEIDGLLREEYGLAPLFTPLVYLPVARTASAFQTSVDLSGYSDFEIKRHSDAVTSRSGTTQLVNLAIGRLAQRYRLLIEKDNGKAATEFREDANLKELTNLLRNIGYHWKLVPVNPLKNQYDVQLSKQGSSFLVGAASSGERELITYLFAIFVLNVRNALILVDEPELHLHPKWQKTLLRLFADLTEKTGNQFLLATHSPTFVSPDSIQFVSRIFSHEQRSRIVRLDIAKLPEARHLLNIINSQNNERLFFADEVVLVEGVSDRIFFEALLDRFGRGQSGRPILEVISVGGKGLFDAYTRVLSACEIKFSIVADLDYVEQIGSDNIKGLFKLDSKEIKSDVIDNIKSSDGAALVNAIDDAMASNNWGGALEVWEYIKSRRRTLRAELKEAERGTLDQFIEENRAKSIHILKRGALEAYLPPGYQSKDLSKLISLLDTDYWPSLPEDARVELEKIVQGLLGDPPAVLEIIPVE